MRDNVEILEKNEEIARKFRMIEDNLSSFLNVKDLFEKLIIQIQEEFDIPFVWISIINEHDLSSLIQALKSSQILKESLNIIDRSAFLGLVANSTKPMLANHNLKCFYKLLPPKKKYFIKSLAVAPMTLNNEIIGSINHGDPSSLRYQPGMDTGLLEKLVLNISSRLSDIMTASRQKMK
jgi:uncharacterized protein YigA (DUF484 family)